MYSYVLTERNIQTPLGTKNLYTVGHYDGAGKWIPESDYNEPELAAARCAFLNGEKPKGFPPYKIPPVKNWHVSRVKHGVDGGHEIIATVHNGENEDMAFVVHAEDPEVNPFGLATQISFMPEIMWLLDVVASGNTDPDRQSELVKDLYKRMEV